LVLSTVSGVTEAKPRRLRLEQRFYKQALRYSEALALLQQSRDPVHCRDQSDSYQNGPSAVSCCPVMPMGCRTRRMHDPRRLIFRNVAQHKAGQDQVQTGNQANPVRYIRGQVHGVPPSLVPTL
jgi:hypothetical protein